MKAKGHSGSLRFSARLKCTRPTSRQRLSRLLRKSCSERPLSAFSTESAFCIDRHSASRTAGRRYSPPRMGGASSIKASSSSGDGSGMFASDPAAGSWRAQSVATKRIAKPRQNASAGERRLPTSRRPSCNNPWPSPRAKRSASRLSTAASRRKSSSAVSGRNAPCGVRTGASESDIGARVALRNLSYHLSRKGRVVPPENRKATR
jgi:hypothetical protein